MSKRQVEARIKKWKSKAIERGKENAYLKSRIQELTVSRSKWKSKYQAEKLAHGKLQLAGKKAKGHQYGLVLVALMVELYKYGGMSLRSCRHTVGCLYLCLGLKGKIPCHNSIRNWVCKCGVSHIQETAAQNDGYVIYVDESISFGSEKILLVLGVNTSAIPKDRSLSHLDMEVLAVEVGSEWKSGQVVACLERATLNKRVGYVVSDEGRNLKKSYTALGYSHIEDCTHLFANHLKRLYQSDEDFVGFGKLIGGLRQKWSLSKDYSSYTPPSMRGKLRFANIFPSVNWAVGLLGDWENLPARVQEEVLFLKGKKDFVMGLSQVERLFKTACKKLKDRGFGVCQKQELVDGLAEIETKAGGSLQPKARVFMKNIMDYLVHLESKSKALDEDFLLCSSDIIESYFGKFKAKVNTNRRGGLTEFIFSMATFGKTFSVDEVQSALESIKCKDLKSSLVKVKSP
jgi:hypothetical protein